MPGTVPATQWRRATDRADRVLAAVVLIGAAMAGTLFGAARAPSSTQVVTVFDKIVERTEIAQPPPLSKSDASMDLLTQHRCLAEAMYYEARGEGESGEKAVAEVVFHRLRSGGYGHSICQVVYKGAPRPGCQFSFACDGSLARTKTPADWRKAQLLAAQILTGQEPLSDATAGALNYHAIRMRPDWAEKLVRTARIGNHIFYRPRRSELAFATFRHVFR